MSDGQVLLLAGGILLAIVLFIGGVGGFIFWYHSRPTPEATVAQSPRGPVVQIPTRQISVVRSSMPLIALWRYALRGTLTVSPEGIEYTRVLSPKQHGYDEIRQVESPPPGDRGTRLTIHFTSGWGLVVLTGTAEDRHLALVELSRWCRVAPAKR